MNAKNNRRRNEITMDTVSLKLQYPDFEIVRPELFKPRFVWLDPTSEFITKERNGFQKYTQNASAEDRKNGLHRPLLTLYRRFDDKLSYDLHIEFSVPKMLFGNNLQELRDEDFHGAVKRLKDELAAMGVRAEEGAIRRATVTKAHFGKNIVLPEPWTVREINSHIYKLDAGKQMQVKQRDFDNDGEALYFYTSAHNIVLYDKVKDILKPKNVSADKNKTKNEKDVVNNILSPNAQILRIEVRFTRQASLTPFISRILNEEIENISFEKIFRKELWRKAVLTTWEELIDQPSNQLALKMTISPEEALNALLAKGQYASNAHALNKVLINFGLYTLISQLGPRLVRKKLKSIWSDKSCVTRLNEKISASAVTLSEIPTLPFIGFIRSKISEFERYDLPADWHS